MKKIAWRVLLGLATLVSASAQATALNLVQQVPDVFTDTTVVYTYTAICQKSNGATGPCAGQFNQPRPDLSSGVLSINDLNGTLFYDNGTSQTGFFGDMTLSATFTGYGIFSSGSLSISQTNATTLPGLPTGPITIMSGSIFNFGFAGTGSGGILEFETNVTGGAWLALTSKTGTIAGTTISSGIPTGAWTDSSLFQHSWSGSSTPDTFVPVPAAAWLLGSGLIALVGVSRRHRKAA
jgi:hypothetical protein